MHDIGTLVAFIANVAICVRLLTYQRGRGARHRPVVSACAWWLVVCTGGAAIEFLLRATASPMWSAGVLLVLLAVLLRARGNLASLLDFPA